MLYICTNEIIKQNIMITTMEIPFAKERIKADEMNTFFNVEVWENDNTYFSDGLKDPKFEFEISKLDAIKMAKTILTNYGL